MRATVAEISVSAIKHNIQILRSHVKSDTKFEAVVKANAYGHGMLEVAKIALEAGAEQLGVAIVEEGVELREAGITAPIHVLGALLADCADTVVTYDLIATVFTEDMLQALETEAKRQGKTASVYLKIDTGLNRIGVKGAESLRVLLTMLQGCKNLRLEGMFTHFAVSELPDKTFTAQQCERFEAAAKLAREMGFTPLLHAANSGATLDMPEGFAYDMVRCGIAMYGYAPAKNCSDAEKLIPALTWKTKVVFIKEIERGDTVSYGRHYTAQGKRRVATLPLGYGDGFKRCMEGRAHVLINGQRAPVLGVICMDQFVVDVTDIPNVQVGDEAVLLGRQKEACISADEMAAWAAGTISYEVLLSISARVPRVYCM